MAYDGSAESIRGIEAARGLAAQSGGTVRALMVVPIATIPYDEPVRDRLPACGEAPGRRELSA